MSEVSADASTPAFIRTPASDPVTGSVVGLTISDLLSFDGRSRT